MKNKFKTNMEHAKQSAANAAKHDIYHGRKCNPCRHGARNVSAWAKWYTDEYEKLRETLPHHLNNF